MQLLRQGETIFGGRDVVFRHSPVRVIAGSLILIAAATVAFAIDWPLAWFVAVFVVITLLVMRRAIVARLQRTNWLVRLTDDGLLIHFRNYLNFHFPEDVPTVAYLRFDELDSAHRAKIKWQVSDERGVTMNTRHLIELVLKDEQPELAAALTAERSLIAPRERRWYGSTATKYGGYPVRLEGMRRLQIEWYVRPDADDFLHELRARGIHVDEPATVDLSDDKSDREKLLLELVESGRKVEAMRLARSIYGYDLKEAKHFVDGFYAAQPDSTP